MKKKAARLPVLPERDCGTCNACCTVLAISSPLDKPAGVPCVHLVPETTTGCGIYAARPLDCSEYLCGWRRGLGTTAERPDRVGVLLTPKDNKHEVVEALALAPFSFVAHEVWPGTFDEPAGLALLTQVAGHFIILGFRGARLDKCRFMGPEDQVRAIACWLGENGYTSPTGILRGSFPDAPAKRPLWERP